MTMDGAVKFINRARADEKLRKKLNIANDNSERKAILTEEGLNFNFAEFEDAFNSMHGNCQTADEAMDLKEIKLWWDFLLQS